MKTIVLPSLPDTSDTWSEVELYRWQHGVLPNAPGHVEQPLSVPKGLVAMANAIKKGNLKNFPTPYNVIEVLNYAARRIERGANEVERVKKALETANKILAEHGVKIGALPDEPNETKK